MYFKLSTNICFFKLPFQTHKIHTGSAWVVPKGFNTEIKVFNCITKKKEPLILKNKNILTWYTCGPTVYDSSHIGHASCYVKFDIIHKILRKYFKYNLVTAINITDIDDKIIRRANELKVECKILAGKFENEFWDDFKKLGIDQPSIVLRVTEDVPLIIEFIKKLVEKDQAYKATDNSVYFSVDRVNNYGKLQNIGIVEEKQKSGYVKKSSLDFALWKSKKEGEPFWESPWGKGRPGWHIECSALASLIFGSNIDIHAGGIDLRFPHHENEEAQSCAFHETPQWVNYWLHSGYLHLSQSEKMSKSLKNTISVQDMLKTVSPDDFRMACIMSSYQNNMEYSEKLMSTAKQTYKTFKNCIVSCDDYQKGYLKATVNNDILNELLNKCADSVHKALCDNFDTPSVIKTLGELVTTTNIMLHTTCETSNTKNGLVSILAVKNFLSDVLETFGLNVNQNVNVDKDFSEIVDILNEFRQEIRNRGIQDKDKNLLQLCDNARDSAKKCGINFKDHGKLSSWSIE